VPRRRPQQRQAATNDPLPSDAISRITTHSLLTNTLATTHTHTRTNACAFIRLRQRRGLQEVTGAQAQRIDVSSSNAATIHRSIPCRTQVPQYRNHLSVSQTQTLGTFLLAHGCRSFIPNHPAAQSRKLHPITQPNHCARRRTARRPTSQFPLTQSSRIYPIGTSHCQSMLTEVYPQPRTEPVDTILAIAQPD
jgi:hypothetical protein